MGKQDEAHRPQSRTNRIGGEGLEVGLHILRVSMNATHDAGIQILQAPSSHHSIEAQDNHGGDDTHQSHGSPSLMLTQVAIGTCRIGSRMATNDKLAHHARQTQQDDAHQVDEDEGGTSILTCHIRKAPYISQTYRRTCRGENDAQFTSEISSTLHCFLYFYASALSGRMTNLL